MSLHRLCRSDQLTMLGGAIAPIQGHARYAAIYLTVLMIASTRTWHAARKTSPLR